MFYRFLLFLVALTLCLAVVSVQAQDETPTPEVEATEVVSVPEVSVALLQQQISTLQTTVNVMTGIIVVLILTIGLALVLLGRSAPPGAFKDIATAVGGPILQTGVSEVLTNFEREVELTESQLDDIAAKIARQVFDKLTTHPANPAAPVPAPTDEAKG